jgi:hypothetical protein
MSRRGTDLLIWSTNFTPPGPPLKKICRPCMLKADIFSKRPSGLPRLDCSYPSENCLMSLNSAILAVKNDISEKFWLRTGPKGCTDIAPMEFLLGAISYQLHFCSLSFGDQNVKPVFSSVRFLL